MIQLFVIGLVVGFLFYELTGISPGGVIVPAYLALYLHEPAKILMTLLLSLVVLLAIRFLGTYLIIYGRRKFLLALLFGFLLKLLTESFVQPVALPGIDLQSIGYIIPGIIANELDRQQIIPTFLSLGIVTLVVYQISMLLS